MKTQTEIAQLLSDLTNAGYVLRALPSKELKCVNFSAMERLSDATRQKIIEHKSEIVNSHLASHFPLSLQQKQLWFFDQYANFDKTIYHIPFIRRIKGDLNINALELSFQHLISRHEILRTIFKTHEHHPAQFILEDQPFFLEAVSADEDSIEEKLRSEIITPFSSNFFT